MGPGSKNKSPLTEVFVVAVCLLYLAVFLMTFSQVETFVKNQLNFIVVSLISLSINKVAILKVMQHLT